MSPLSDEVTRRSRNRSNEGFPEFASKIFMNCVSLLSSGVDNNNDRVNNQQDNNILLKKTNHDINVNVKKIPSTSNRKGKKNNRKNNKRRKEPNAKKNINYERISLQEMIALRNRSIVSSMVANETKKLSINEDDTCCNNEEEEKKSDEYMHYNKMDKKLNNYLSPQQKKRLSDISYNIESLISTTDDDDNDKPIDLSQGTIQFSAFGMQFSAFDINDNEDYFNNEQCTTTNNIDNSGRRRKSSALIIKRDGSVLMKWHKDDDDDDYDSDIDIDLEEGCILIDLSNNYDDYSDLDDDDY